MQYSAIELDKSMVVMAALVIGGLAILAYILYALWSEVARFVTKSKYYKGRLRQAKLAQRRQAYQELASSWEAFEAREDARLRAAYGSAE